TLQHDLGPEGLEFLGGFWHERDPVFAGRTLAPHPDGERHSSPFTISKLFFISNNPRRLQRHGSAEGRRNRGHHRRPASLRRLLVSSVVLALPVAARHG